MFRDKLPLKECLFTCTVGSVEMGSFSLVVKYQGTKTLQV